MVVLGVLQMYWPRFCGAVVLYVIAQATHGGTFVRTLQFGLTEWIS